MSAPAVLVLAGLDPSGGAGLLADAETVRAMGAHPLCVATALTVQTTRAARRFQPVDPSLIADTMRALLEEEDVRAIKVGMVGDAANARAIRALLPAGIPAVVDPVLAASSGAPLFSGPPRELLERGPLAVLLKGGHLAGEPVDVLATASGIEQFAAARIPAEARGTGCRLASAIAAGLARGVPLRDAVIAARRHVREYLQERLPV